MKNKNCDGVKVMGVNPITQDDCDCPYCSGGEISEDEIRREYM